MGGLASEDHNIEHFGWVAPCIGSATCKDFSPDGASSVASPIAFGPQKRTAMRNWAEKIFWVYILWDYVCDLPCTCSFVLPYFISYQGVRKGGPGVVRAHPK